MKVPSNRTNNKVYARQAFGSSPRSKTTRAPILAASAALAVGLAGTANASPALASGLRDAEGNVSFTFGYYGNTEELNVYQQEISLYEKTHPGVQITATYDAPAPFLAKLPILFRAGTGPDVVNLAEAWVGGLDSTFHPFLNLAPYLTAAGVTSAQFEPGSWVPGTIDNQILMLPNIYYGHAVAINENLFRAAHLAIPSNGWTTDQLLSDAAKMTSGTGSHKIWGVAVSLSIGQSVIMFGGNTFNLATSQMTIDRPDAVKGITWDVDLILKDHVAPPLPAPNQSVSVAPAVDPFLTGQAAMDLTYAAYDQASYDQAVGNKFQWTVVPYPSGTFAPLQLNAAAIVAKEQNSPSKYKAEFAFVQWLAENPQATALEGQLAGPAYLPAEQAWLSHPPSDWASVNRQAVQAANGRSVYGYDGGKYTEVNVLAGNVMDSMLLGQISVAKGVQEIQSQGKAILNGSS